MPFFVLLLQMTALSGPPGSPFPDSFNYAISAHSSERARVFGQPVLDTPVLGVIEQGGDFPIHEILEDRSCPGGYFLRIARSHFVCSAHFSPSARFPARAPVVVVDETMDSSLAWRRTKVATPVWASRADRLAGKPAFLLPRNAHLLYRKRYVTVDGELMYLTLKDYLVASADLEEASPSTFSGKRTEGAGDLAWAVVYRYPTVPVVDLDRGRPRRRLQDKTWVRLATTEPVERDGRKYYRIEDGWGVSEEHLRLFTLGEPPEGTAPGEPWIEVNMTSQTLVAYEGSRPVFRTLISSGRVGTDTVPGLYRIYFKRAVQDVSRKRAKKVDYFFESVPFVQFFHGVFAFHSAMWHHAFGFPHSMGCVETSLRDAAFLFGWTHPRVPDGYLALTDSVEDPGTLVRIVKFPGHRVPTRFHPRAVPPEE
ncbi:L,D-transpeptidase [Myxococcota bacterium]|nr:L,D-transpeptidase [Myxococcota bacterium]